MAHDDGIVTMFDYQPQLGFALQYLDYQNGQLRVGGFNATELASIVGGEPFYAYSREAVRQRVDSLRELLPAEIKVHYAIKANPYPALVQYMAGLVDGFDVASRRELQIAVETGIEPARIGFAGPGKSDQDLIAAIAAGCLVHVESEGELVRLRKFAEGRTVKVALRINPVFELKAAGMKMTGGAKPFGIDQEQVELLIKSFNWDSLVLTGFHFYCGSQSLQSSAIIESQREILSVARNWLPYCHGKPYLNIGGGFGIPYFPNDKALDEKGIYTGMAALKHEFADVFATYDVVLELGRFLVAQAGVYFCKVRDIKQSKGTHYLVCSGGLHHHLANSGNFGQVVRRNYPVLLADRVQQPAELQMQVVGPLCTPLDVLADKVMLPKAETDDWFAVLLSGAYGATASPLGFLGHDGVRELLV